MAALAAANPPQAPRLMPMSFIHEDIEALQKELNGSSRSLEKTSALAIREDLHMVLNRSLPSLERSSLAIRIDLDQQVEPGDLRTSLAFDHSSPSLERIHALANRIALHHQRQTRDLRTLLDSLSTASYPVLIRAHVLRASYRVLIERAIESLSRCLDANHLHEPPEAYIQTIAASIQRVASSMDRQTIVQDILDGMEQKDRRIADLGRQINSAFHLTFLKNSGVIKADGENFSSSVASPVSLPFVCPQAVKTATEEAQTLQQAPKRENDQDVTKQPTSLRQLATRSPCCLIL